MVRYLKKIRYIQLKDIFWNIFYWRISYIERYILLNDIFYQTLPFKTPFFWKNVLDKAFELFIQKSRVLKIFCGRNVPGKYLVLGRKVFIIQTNFSVSIKLLWTYCKIYFIKTNCYSSIVFADYINQTTLLLLIWLEKSTH